MTTNAAIQPGNNRDLSDRELREALSLSTRHGVPLSEIFRIHYSSEETAAEREVIATALLHMAHTLKALGSLVIYSDRCLIGQKIKDRFAETLSADISYACSETKDPKERFETLIELSSVSRGIFPLTHGNILDVMSNTLKEIINDSKYDQACIDDILDFCINRSNNHLLRRRAITVWLNR